MIVRRLLSYIFDILQTVVLAAAMFVVIYLFAAQPHQVRGASMEPNFHNGEYILTEKVSYKFRSPKRGEVIIFAAPNRPDVDYIKRVIGVPGDRIRLNAGIIYINDQPMKEQYELPDLRTYPGRFLQENQEFLMPADTFFVMGDNRSHSSDSREFGPIRKETIVGHALFRYWPPNRFGVLATPSYEPKVRSGVHLNLPQALF